MGDGTKSIAGLSIYQRKTKLRRADAKLARSEKRYGPHTRTKAPEDHQYTKLHATRTI